MTYGTQFQYGCKLSKSSLNYTAAAHTLSGILYKFIPVAIHLVEDVMRDHIVTHERLL